MYNLEDIEKMREQGVIDEQTYQKYKAIAQMNEYMPNQAKTPMNAYEMTNYGKNLQAQAEPMEQNFDPSFGYDPRQEKIAKLESQIAMVKERIERNKRALVGKSYEDVNRKLAQLDMKKVGLRLNHNNANTDPTNLWRWNQGRLDTKEANARVDSNQVYKFNNTVDMYENMFANRDLNKMTTAEMIGELKNLESVKRDGKNVGADTSRVDAMLNKLYKALNGDTVSTPNETSTEYSGTVQDQTNASFDDFYNQKHSSKEWEEYRKNHSLDNEQINKIKAKEREARETEKRQRKANAFKQWLKNRNVKTTNERILATEKRLFEAQYKEGE